MNCSPIAKSNKTGQPRYTSQSNFVNRDGVLGIILAPLSQSNVCLNEGVSQLPYLILCCSLQARQGVYLQHPIIYPLLVICRQPEKPEP